MVGTPSITLRDAAILRLMSVRATLDAAVRADGDALPPGSLEAAPTSQPNPQTATGPRPVGKRA
ncbi:hypothetical protein GVN21_16795 [Caulobacter sp. SLTY]|uniref:hypothetical protein n=1 Tax=Caulobacter sp. SLTY TaxID=2683262 RepID=UPI001413649C|nr:hypothetical protein [Caulobacter sp. SLTY]NBB17026.1 hypothetical protein [Caulobacter sp. SLTY]